MPAAVSRTAEFQALIGSLRSTRNRDLTLALDYEAVSYFCGDQRPKTKIVLNGCSVDVPATAAHALRGLRSKDEWRILWIDALCVDQGNDTERAHQVLQLAKVYASATRTLVWLGDEDESLTESFASCLEGFRQSELSQPTGGPLPKGAELISRHQGTSLYSVPLSLDASSSIARAHENAVSGIVALLSKYLRRPWFNRLWMYQEVLLAQQCVCCVGVYELEWSYAQRAFHYTRDMPHETSDVGEFGSFAPWASAMITSPRSASDPDIARSLKQLLLETIPLKCSNDRDKVYALLGLTRWSKRRETIPIEVWPDYTKSVRECMRDATCAVIYEDTDLDCLLLRTLTGPKPTWMIPWQRLGDSTSVVDYVERKGRSHSFLDCSLGQPLDCDIMRVSGVPDSLFLRGLRFRRVARVSTVTSEKALQEVSIPAKLRTLMERIDDITDGKVREIDPRLIYYTILWSHHGFAAKDWWHPRFKHILHFRHPSLRATDQQDICPKLEEADGQCEDKERHDESSSDNNEGRSSSGDHVQSVSGNISESRTTTPLRPSDRSVLERDDDTQSNNTSANLKAEPVLHRMIRTLQDNWHSNFPPEVHTSEIPGLEEPADRDLHLNSCLDHCLTKSRFYIPAPDWSETKPVEFSIGIGPAEMEPGDQVAILFGCKHPVILRPDGPSWLYVGPAYAQEMMGGIFVKYWKVLPEHLFTVVDSEVFELR